MSDVAEIHVKNLDNADEIRKFVAHGYAEFVTAGGMRLSRGTFEPGWRWSQDVKPIMQTDTCPVHHLGLILSGRMRIEYDDGTSADLRPGDVIDVAPGHEAMVLGEEPCVVIDVSPDFFRYAAPHT
ncbi:MAG: cupin domain-containing protein [Actinomycetes bacterium]